MEYQRLRRTIKRITDSKNLTKQDRESLKELKARLQKTPSVIRDENTGKRVYYNRYADDWVIGVTGNFELAKKIKEEANNFLKDILKVELSEEKTKITHVGRNKVEYLGFDISRRTRIYTESQSSLVNATGRTRRPSSSSVIIEAPINKLMEKLVELGFAWEKDRAPRAITRWIYLNPEDIIRRFN